MGGGRVTRREVIVGGLALALLGPAACTARQMQAEQEIGGGVVEAEPDDLAGRMRALVPDAEAVALAATAFIRAIDDEPDEEALVRALLDDRTAWHDADDDALRDHLSQQARSDYAERRITDVGGWIVSVTEARLAALVGIAA